MLDFGQIANLIVEHWDLIAAVVVILSATGIGGSIYKTHRTRVQQRRLRQIPSGEFPFEVIAPRSPKILQQLMPDSRGENDPLAEFNIPYQTRQPDRNVRQELEQAFSDQPWVLILGKSGLGKTREAAHLAELLNGEGWTVLKLGESGWLDEPRQFPDALQHTDKLLFFLDDLNHWCYRGNPREMPANADDPSQPLRVPVQERLLKTLAFFEQECRPGNVRVIATARNETQPDREEGASPYDCLQWEKYPKLWQRFHCYELAEASPQSVVELLSDRVRASQLAAVPADYDKIARRNDGTFRNIVENLRKAQNRNLTVSLGEFSEQMDQTWRQQYKTAVKRYPAAKLVYDAVELLRRLNLWLHPAMVAVTASLLSQKRGLAAWWQKWQIWQALVYLQQAENILQPRDGQIEAKKTPSVSLDYVPQILKQLARMGQYYSQPELASNFFGCGFAFSALGRKEEAISSYDKAIEFKPDYHEAWNNRGFAFSALGRKEEAISSYDKAIKYKPDYQVAWFNRGRALYDLGRKEEAIFSYDKAIEYKQNDHIVWNNRGAALYDLGRKEEAISSYDKAIEFKPDSYDAWNNRGLALSALGRKEEAVSSFDKVIEFKPDDYQAWNNRGHNLANLKQYEAAVDSYDWAIAIKPDYRFPHHSRGGALVRLQRYDEALASFDRALELEPDWDRAHYNKACCYALMGDVIEAVDCLSRAIALDPTNRELAKTDSDFDRIRGEDWFRAVLEEGT